MCTNNHFSSLFEMDHDEDEQPEDEGTSWEVPFQVAHHDPYFPHGPAGASSSSRMFGPPHDDPIDRRVLMMYHIIDTALMLISSDADDAIINDKDDLDQAEEDDHDQDGLQANPLELVCHENMLVQNGDAGRTVHTTVTTLKNGDECMVETSRDLQWQVSEGERKLSGTGLKKHRLEKEGDVRMEEGDE